MANINNLTIPYGDFQLNQIIDPDQFDANSEAIRLKVNEIISKLNITTETDIPTLTAQVTNALTKDNVTPYTPTNNYNPAHKLYVDNLVAGVIAGSLAPGSVTDDKLSNAAGQIKDTVSKKANLTGGNTFTGDQTVSDGVINIKRTASETANKRWFNWSIGGSTLYLIARNDVGAYIRDLLQFFHDGGMRILGKLTVDSSVQTANNTGFTALTTGGEERNIGYIGTNNTVYLGDNNQPTTIQGTSASAPMTTFRAQGGSEGGEIRLEKPVSGTSITGDVLFDLSGNTLRIFQSTSPYKGVHVDMTVAGDAVSNRLSQDRGWKTVTLATGSWTTPSGLTGYPYAYGIVDNDFVIGDVVDFEVGYGGSGATQIDVAESAGMSNSVYGGTAGTFYFMSKSVPSAVLNVKYRINK